MNNEMTMKEKRFIFFADPQERKAESQPTFGTLPFAPTHEANPSAKSKEPFSRFLIVVQTIYNLFK